MGFNMALLNKTPNRAGVSSNSNRNDCLLCVAPLPNGMIAVPRPTQDMQYGHGEHTERHEFNDSLRYDRHTLGEFNCHSTQARDTPLCLDDIADVA